jgi:hypothetical protein
MVSNGSGSSSKRVSCSTRSEVTGPRPGPFRHDWRGRWAKCAVMAGPERSTSMREHDGQRISWRPVDLVARITPSAARADPGVRGCPPETIMWGKTYGFRPSRWWYSAGLTVSLAAGRDPALAEDCTYQGRSGR